MGCCLSTNKANVDDSLRQDSPTDSGIQPVQIQSTSFPNPRGDEEDIVNLSSSPNNGTINLQLSQQSHEDTLHQHQNSRDSTTNQQVQSSSVFQVASPTIEVVNTGDCNSNLQPLQSSSIVEILSPSTTSVLNVGVDQEDVNFHPSPTNDNRNLQLLHTQSQQSISGPEQNTVLNQIMELELPNTDSSSGNLKPIGGIKISLDSSTDSVRTVIGSGNQSTSHDVPADESFVDACQTSNQNIAKPVSRKFTYAELCDATDDFANLLGKGGFGEVYRGQLKETGIDNQPQIINVAIKKLKDKKNSEGEFKAECMLYGIDHQNIIKLIGVCDEGGERCIVYELMSLGTLKSHLPQYSKENKSNLHGNDEKEQWDWNTRMKIAIGIAEGLDYLHNTANIIHLDLKSSNILLDEGHTPKIADFGLARNSPSIYLGDPAGTYGYKPYELANAGMASYKADIFSFGVIFLELITGKRVLLSTSEGDEVDTYLADWAKTIIRKVRKKKVIELEKVPDPFLRNEYQPEALKLARRCIKKKARHRPDIRTVIECLTDLTKQPKMKSDEIN